MNDASPDNREGVRFFGTVSASVSHEVKNVLAVVNEAAGLLEDFTVMAERGMPIDPARLKRAARSIQGQVRRGDTIIKNMNAFAHSADAPEAGEDHETDLAETLRLAVGLFTRMADMRQVTLALGEVAPAVSRASGFDVIHLLHGAMGAAFAAMSAGDALTVSLTGRDAGATFTLSVPGRSVAPPGDAEFSALAQRLGATAQTEENGALAVTLGR
jgi:hypothetical protein